MQRRELLAGLALAAIGRAASAPPDTSETREEGRYRVDAAVLLLGVPIIRRAQVGEARMSLRIAASGAVRRIGLEFAAASDPARAHGLDRMGWVRELVLERSGSAGLATLLGVMSDSPEQSVDEARASFAPGQAQRRFIAIDSEHAPAETRSRVARFAHAPGSSAIAAGMADDARRCLDSAAPAWRRTGRARMASTFLYAIWRALESGQPVCQTGYFYNEDDFRLALRRSGEGGGLERIRGVLQNLSQGRRPIAFDFWMDRGAARLPARIELQPRSFLRLRLERLDPNSEKETT
jgi:hypothetical protein